MRISFLLSVMMITTSLFGQSDQAFRSALAGHVDGLSEGSIIVVEYNKKGCWGAYEGGTMTFTLKQNEVFIELANTNGYNKEKETTSSAYKKSVLIDRLLTAVDPDQDPDNIVINNTINYNILVDGVSRGIFSSTLEPHQVINKVQLNPNFSDFFKKGKSKKGIFIK